VEQGVQCLLGRILAERDAVTPGVPWGRADGEDEVVVVEQRAAAAADPVGVGVDFGHAVADHLIRDVGELDAA
jgi:hypothetical protein